MFKGIGTALALALGMVGFHVQTHAAYPSKPLRMVIPAPAGGPFDQLGRNFARALSEIIKTQVVVDNKPGASTSIGAGDVAKSVPDGYTVLFAPDGTFTNVPNVLAKPPYDPIKDFEPISFVAVTVPALVARPEVPGRSVKDLASTNKDTPLSFGTWGPGTLPHLFAASLSTATAMPLTIVSYKGNAPALQDLLGGHIQLTMLAVVQARDLHKTGAVKILGVGGNSRAQLLPDVPTFVEQGMTAPVARMATWSALVAPKGTPRDVVKTLTDASTAALMSPSMQKYMAENGWEVVPSSPGEFQGIVQRELQELGEALRAVGIRPQ